MAMLKTVSLLVLVAVAGVLVYAALQPDTFRVARSTTVQAPLAKLQPMIADLHQFNTWNPYNHKDPQMHGEYRGPATGPGAAYHFAGNKDVGKGSLQVLAITHDTVTMQLHMLEPFEGRNTVEFSLAPRGHGTQVTWAMHGPNTFIGRLFGVFMDMDKMIGRDFEAGLDALKQRAERT
jgi:hypothetical protein